MNRIDPIPRRGFTLTEMVVVMAMAGTVMLLSTGLIVLSMRVDQRLGVVRQQVLPINRLAEQLRTDLLNVDPDQLKIEEQGSRLTFPVLASGTDNDTSKGQVEYLLRERSCERQVTADSGETTAREQFQLTTAGQTRWEFERETRLLSLQLSQAGSDSGPEFQQSVYINVGRLLMANASAASASSGNSEEGGQ